jgi:hypothetical protein
VTSLDQLYTQALGVAPVLWARCAAWAAESGGTIPPHDHDGGGCAGDAAWAGALPACLEEWVRRGAVKAPGRAAEKALACYGGDVSRVVDVCRARMAFDDAGGMLRCLREIRRDAPHVRVVRAKDRLWPPDGGRRAAGFRVRAFPPPAAPFSCRDSGVSHSCRCHSRAVRAAGWAR